MYVNDFDDDYTLRQLILINKLKEQMKNTKIKIIQNKINKSDPTGTAKILAVIEIYPYDGSTNLLELQNTILMIKENGLKWDHAFQTELVVASIYKLIMSFTIENNKVSILDIIKQVDDIYEYVQSVNITSISKAN